MTKDPARGSLILLVICSLAQAGCTEANLISTDILTGRTPTAPPPSLGGTNAPGVDQTGRPAARSPHAARAEPILARLLTTNAQLGINPVLVVRETAKPIILHSGETKIILSEGLIDRCQRDEQLAAVLALELGKMTVERRERSMAGGPGGDGPLYVPIGRDFGSSGEADPLRRAELAVSQLDRQRLTADEPRPDANLLARQYLSKAGYPEGELSSIPALMSTPTLGDPKRLPPQRDLIREADPR